MQKNNLWDCEAHRLGVPLFPNEKVLMSVRWISGASWDSLGSWPGRSSWGLAGTLFEQWTRQTGSSGKVDVYGVSDFFGLDSHDLWWFMLLWYDFQIFSEIFQAVISALPGRHVHAFSHASNPGSSTWRADDSGISNLESWGGIEQSPKRLCAADLQAQHAQRVQEKKMWRLFALCGSDSLVRRRPSKIVRLITKHPKVIQSDIHSVSSSDSHLLLTASICAGRGQHFG